VRAFGLFLKDLVDRLEPSSVQKNSKQWSQLLGLATSTMNPVPSARPPFSSIAQKLKQI
jgi:hypothetical protein